MDRFSVAMLGYNLPQFAKDYICTMQQWLYIL